jgi:Terminase RNaseH-like domain
VVAILNPINIGIDIGKVNDPSAVSVAEAAQYATGAHRYTGRIPPHVDHRGFFDPGKDTDPIMKTRYVIRQMQRLKLGLGYPEQAKLLEDLLCNAIFRDRELRVFVDITGVGRPVYEDIRSALTVREEVLARRNPIQWRPVNFVHGETYNRRTGSLGKGFLVSRLQALLQNGRIDGPNTAEMLATIEELRVYESKISDEGAATYGAKTGKHDDLATALALSCLEDPFSDQVTYSNKRVY